MTSGMRADHSAMILISGGTGKKARTLSDPKAAEFGVV
jgi:hypothetical protein